MRAAPILLLLLAAVWGCDGAASRWIDQARAANAQADAAGEEGAATRALEDLVSRPPPAGVAAQDARAVLQDAWGRLASLALRAGRPEIALRRADAGLLLGEGRDVFTSSLRILRGRALEALGREAEAAGDYQEAQAILAGLLDEAMGDGGAR
jgi:tetratricopeptide (TPR) repeat protein